MARKKLNNVVRLRKRQKRGDRPFPVTFLIDYWGLILVIAMIVGAALYGTSGREWTLADRMRHLSAAPNCAAARAVGLAPAKRGDPGYYERHDADGDGISCEPYRSGP